MDSEGVTFIHSFDIPYVSRVPTDGRQLVVGPYYEADGDEWEAYTQLEGDRLMVLKPVSLTDGTYVAERPEAPDLDLRLHFSEAVRNYFSLPEVTRYLPELEKDVINSLSSLSKYFLILKYGNENESISSSQMIASEIEYAFANHRSVYDLLNRVVSEVYSYYHQNPSSLPDSFRRVAQQDRQALQDKYFLPSEIIEFYKMNEHPFMTLRKIRDGFLHHGHSVKLIFHTKDGFAVSLDSDLASKLSDLELWPEEKRKENGLLSLLPLFSFLAKDIISTLRQCTEMLYRSFQNDPPEPLYREECRVYMKSKMAIHMSRVEKYMSDHWLAPDQGLES